MTIQYDKLISIIRYPIDSVYLWFLRVSVELEVEVEVMIEAWLQVRMKEVKWERSKSKAQVSKAKVATKVQSVISEILLVGPKSVPTIIQDLDVRV